MKKFTFMMIALLCAVVTFAALMGKQSESPFKFLQKSEMVKMKQPTLKVKAQDRKAQPTRNAVKKAPAELVTPPDGVTAETYYTTGGAFCVQAETESGWANATSDMPSVNVVIDGSDMYIQRLAYWFETAWIKGTIEGTTVTFPSGQYIGSDEYGDEFIVGSEDGETVADIVFEYDSEAGILTATTLYIIENGLADEVLPYCYWDSPVFSATEPEGPELVELPEGVEVLPYVMTYVDGEDKVGSTPVNVAVDGNDVYVQGISYYVPEAWVKGVKDGDEVTFAAMQYVGDLSSYGSSYAFYNGDAVFTFDAEAGTYTAEGEIYGVLGNRYYDGYYVNPVLSPVVEKAVMPANPEVIGLTNTNYGYVVEFNVPAVDINGDGLVTDKLSFTFYTDIEGEIAQMTFTPETHTRLAEALAEIPYGFTEDYDFYSTYIYLNDLYSEDWNNIGIQSIYRGGGEENATEIQWFHIKDYAKPEVPTKSFAWVAAEQGYEDAEDVAEFVIAEEEGTPIVTAVVDQAGGKNPPKYYTSGEALRMYADNTLTITSEEPMVKIEFTMTGSPKQMSLEADKGDYVFDSNVGTWTGKETEVMFNVPNGSGNQARIQKIEVFFESEGGNVPGTEDGFLFNFDDGTLQTWTTIDADGDTYTWANTQGSGYATFNESKGAVFSQSYVNGVGALTPDNYFVSPKLKLDGSITFYACAQDASYPSEHFGVFVSTKGNTDAADFELVEDWTMTASRTDNQTSSSRGVFRSPLKAKGSWYKYTVDLSNYEGAEGYVAIRHFDCSDNFCLVVDDINLVSSWIDLPDYFYSPAEGVVESLSEFTLSFNNYDIVVEEDAKATLTNTTTSNVWTDEDIEVNGKTLTIEMNEEEITEPGEYTLTITGVKKADGEEIELTFTYTIEAAPELVELPEGVVAETYTLKASGGSYNSSYQTYVTLTVEEEAKVAFDGSDVYVSGLAYWFKDAFVKGTLTEDNKVVFSSGQFVGEDEYGQEFLLAMIDDEETGTTTVTTEFVFDFDAETRTLTLSGDALIAETSATDPDSQDFGIYTYLNEAVYTPGGIELPEPVVAPEGLETETWYLSASSYNEGTIAGQEIQVGIDGTDIYMQGICYELPEAWIKGTIDTETNTATFATGQFFGQVEGEDEDDETTTYNFFFVGYGQGGIEDVVFDIDNEAGLMTTDQYIILNTKQNTVSAYDYFTNVTISKDYNGPVTAPEGLETETYLFKAVALEEGEEEADEDYSAQVEVGFDGDDVYIKGISTDNPDFWVKATKNEAGNYVIPANQYMGTMDVWGYFFFDYYFTAVDEEGNFEDVVLSYNPETATFTSDQTLVLNGSDQDIEPYFTYNNVTITKMEDFAATPADPILESYNFEEEAGYNTIYASIPTVDVDGNALLTSKLFYTIWFEKDGVEQPYTFTAALYSNDFEEDLAEIPYSYDGYDIYKGGEIIYLEEDPEELATWTKVGIQTIYYGGGECNKSNIVWYDPETTAIAEVKTGSKNAVIFDLQGRRVAKTAKGLYIMDGKKVVVK